LKCDEKELSRSEPFKPESPFVIVCEGFQDAGFICALLRHLRVGNCDVTFPKKKRDGANGEGGIAAMVSLLSAVPSVEGIAIIRDSDNDAAQSFETACAAYAKPFDVPEQPFTVKRGRHKTTGVFLMPGKGRTGALEHLLLAAVFATHLPLANCIRSLEICNQRATNWSENKKAKMKMQCVIASFCQDDPGCSLGFIWHKGADNPIDFTSPVFQELAAFLIDFATPPVPVGQA
jgi:hypothetical protein